MVELLSRAEQLEAVSNMYIYLERRGSVVVITSACHAASRGSIPGPGMFHH